MDFVYVWFRDTTLDVDELRSKVTEVLLNMPFSPIAVANNVQ